MKTVPSYVTLGCAGAMAATFLVLNATGQNQIAAVIGGFIPARVGGLAVDGALPLAVTPLSAVLLHAGVLHLGFNLLMLIYCGKEDEVALGPGAIAVLLLVGAYAATVFQYLAGPSSAVPMIGASGAISALVGAYAILYGQRRPSRLSPGLARAVHVVWLAAAWIGMQLLLGLASAIEGVAIAAAAHIGGFIAGLLLARPLLRWRYRHA